MHGRQAGREKGGNKKVNSDRQTAMSALGHKQTFAVQKGMSALPPKADMCGALAHVRFGPKAHEMQPSSILNGVVTTAERGWEAVSRLTRCETRIEHDLVFADAAISTGKQHHVAGPEIICAVGYTHHLDARWFAHQKVSKCSVKLDCLKFTLDAETDPVFGARYSIGPVLNGFTCRGCFGILLT